MKEEPKKPELNKSLISNDDFQGMLVLLDSMFQDDYFNENSKAHKKAKLTFENLKKSNCKVHEFDTTMSEFGKKHTLNFWMPAHIYQIWKEEYGPIYNVL